MSSHLGLNKNEKIIKLNEEKAWSYNCKSSFSDFLKKWYDQPLFKGLCMDSLLKKRELNDPEKIAVAIKKWGLSKQKNLICHAKKYKDQLLFLYGEEDVKYKNLYSSLSVQRSSISACSHNAAAQNPNECAHRIKDFLLHRTRSPF